MKTSHILIISALAVGVIFYFFGNPSYRFVNYPPKNNTIVAFGDSLVEGFGSTKGNDFVSVLSKKIDKPIINLGISGNTTKDGLIRINEISIHNPGTVILLLGGNDYLRDIPKEDTFQNLRKIISTLQSKGDFVVLLGIRGGVLKDNFKSSFEDLAREMGTAYVPDVLDGLVGDSRYMSDLVHPNDDGYKIMAEKVYDAVGQYLK